MKVVITGSAGFISSNLAKACLEKGWNVRGVDNYSTGRKELTRMFQKYKNFSFYLRDITKDPLIDIFAGADIIFHLAALPRISYSTDYPIESNNANINGTLRVLEAAKSASVKRLIYSASSSMYGGQDIPFPTPETTPAHPRSNYALQKHTGLEYCRLYSELYGLDTASLIYFNICGQLQFADNSYAGAIPAFFSAAVNNKPCRIDGDGNNSRDWTYVENVVQANILAAEYKGKLNGEHFNIGCGESYSVNEVFREVEKCVGHKLQYTHAPKRLGDPKKSLADISKAKRVLGYEPKVKFYEAIKKTADWWMSGCKI